jgi:hypothetical protein
VVGRSAEVAAARRALRLGRTSRCVAGFAAALLLGCYDAAYPPLVRNGFDVGITLRTAYSDGVVHEDELAPGVDAWIGRESVDIAALSISREGRPIYVLDRSKILEMRRSIGDERRIVWSIEADAIRPLRR